MIVKHKLSMDLAVRNEVPRLFMVQCDTNTRVVELTLTAGGLAWAPEGVENVLVRYHKADGTGGSYDTLPDGTTAWMLAENCLSLTMAPQVLTVPGLVEAQAVLMAGEKCVATFVFRIVVEADPAAGAVESEDYINWTAWAQVELDRHLAEARDSGEFDGVTFYPVVDESGNLSWSNNAGAENPESVNIVELLADEMGDAAYVKRSGDAMTGNLSMGGNRIAGLAAPAADTDAVNKAYTDSLMVQRTASLYSAGWNGQQVTVDVSGVSANNVVFVSPAADSYQTWVTCGLRCTGQSSGKLTFACDSVPTVTVNVSVAIYG